MGAESDVIFSFDSFLYGVAFGLIVAVVVFLQEYFKRLGVQRELNGLRKHLQQKVEIEANSTGRQFSEMEKLRKENENLRVTNKTLIQKPGRSEILNFHIYQKALNFMAEAAPGFAPLWQKALKDAEQEVDDIQEGKSSFMKRIIQLPFSGTKSIDENNNRD